MRPEQMMTFSMDEQEEDQRPEPITGLSRDDHITQFLSLDAQIKELSYRRREHASALTQAAFEEKNGQKTVHLQANDGSRVAVEFKTDWECDPEVETAKELLGAERFNELFKTTYTPKLRNLKSFLSTGFTDERRQTAKQIIKDSVREVDRTPYVMAEKSR